MKKKLLYIEDLYNFYSTKYKYSTHFSSEKSGEPIVVQVHGKINFEDSDKNKDGLMPVHLQACHTNLNINNSNIEESVMTSALPSFSNRPILGYIHKVVTEENPDGQWEFYGHNVHEDENGEIVYDEIPVGIIPESCNAQLVYDKEKEKTYCEVDGYIFEEYSRAAEILKREGECSVSVELSIRELSYDGKSKFLNIEDFWFSGVTILGKNEDGEIIKPGMSGSNIKLADFSSKNNSLFTKYESKMIELQERLSKLESACFNIQSSKEGGSNRNMDKFNELLEKYNKNAEDIDFEYKDMSDEELETKFEEVFGKLERNSTSEFSNDEGTDNDNETEETSEVKEDNACGTKKKKKCSIENIITIGDAVKKYEVSLDDKICSIHSLVNEIYSEADNTYYGTEVYETYVIMIDHYHGKYYKQSYKDENDVYTLVGDRVEVFAEYVTAEEQEELKNMRANYSLVVDELNKYKYDEQFAEKMNVFEDESYSSYLETDEFKALMSKETVDKYTKEELVEKADAALGRLVKKSKTFSCSEKNETKLNKVNFNLKPDLQKKSKAYGTLFK